MGKPFSKEIMEEAGKYSSATFHEAYGKRGALPSSIKPLSPRFRLCGPAFTVLSPPKDNLWLHRAIYGAQPGDVLVVDAAGYTEAGYWGEIMAAAAIERGIAGIVINGGVRDSLRLIELGLPTFSNGVCIQGTAKDKAAHGRLNEPVRIGETRIAPGDLVFGDADGVVAIAREDVREVLDASRRREEAEALILEKLRQGERTLDIYNLN